jgi:hypothetical protein
MLSRWNSKPVEEEWNFHRVLVWTAGISLVLVIVTPLLFKHFRDNPPSVVPDCPAEQAPFQVQIGADSYVDIKVVEPENPVTVPDVSLEDFKMNGADPRDDFYQFLITEAEAADATLRLFTAKDQIKGHLTFYLGDIRFFEGIDPGSTINGCSVSKRTDFQTIRLIQSVYPEGKK